MKQKRRAANNRVTRPTNGRAKSLTVATKRGDDLTDPKRADRLLRRFSWEGEGERG